MTRSEAKQIALEYLRRDVPLILLGSGVDGFVFSDRDQSVYKVFDNREKYERECTVYVKLLG